MRLPLPRRTIDILYSCILIGLILLISGPAFSQSEMDDVEIDVQKVGRGIYMLTGRGGNLGLSVGTDGAFLVDDQYAPLTERITAALASVSDKPVRFVVNTHWHGDHTGGNENLGKAGALIVAHENVRKRMSVEQFIAAFDMRTGPSPAAALPAITFTEEMTFHWNDDVLRVVHVEAAHTDGDSIILFEKANVAHLGDIFFNGMYPFIDAGTGGRIDGIILAVDRALDLMKPDTTIIPGHGPLASVKELRDYRAMLVKVRDRIRPLIDAGKSRDEVIAARPTKDLDETWGGGFLKAETWVGIVFDSIVGR